MNETRKNTAWKVTAMAREYRGERIYADRLDPSMCWFWKCDRLQVAGHRRTLSAAQRQAEKAVDAALSAPGGGKP